MTIKTMKYSEILKENKKLSQNGLNKAYEIAVLSNIMVTPCKEIIEYKLRRHDIGANVSFGDYDNIVKGSSDFKDSNLIIIFWEACNIVDGLQYKADLMSPEDLEMLIEKTKRDIEYVLQELRQTSTVIFNRFSSAVFNSSFLKKNNFDRLVDELNAYLEKTATPNVFLIDTNKMFCRISLDKCIDLRYYYSSKALYSIDFYKEYADFIGPIIMAVNGRSKKIMVFDCDNTLWRGIVGEDGMEGIKVGAHDREGVVFEEVQSLAMALKNRGILLGVCSKNDQEDVEKVFKEHEGVLLKDNDIVIKKINWDDKVVNLENIAKELNIGINSIVYVDDSDFEVDYIRSNYPEIEVVKVPVELFKYPGVIRESLGYFFKGSDSGEDLIRSRLYKEESVRQGQKARFVDYEDYLRDLDLQVLIKIDDGQAVSRIAQLTQKTNQFNLTTKRYTDADIDTFVREDDKKVFSLQVQDKFGDYGMVGLIIADILRKENRAVIDTFLLSCRVLGRNVEFVFFDFIVDYLKGIGIELLMGEYIKTPKNESCKTVYEKLGMNLAGGDDKLKKYSLEMKNYLPHNVNYIKERFDGK